MVKLFVGNLAETVDSNRLKQVFKPFTNIIDCDVVKNYAFITIPDEDKQQVMQRMDGYNIDGKPIQVKLSTSKLRSQSTVPTGCCLRCTSSEHKTPNCPDDPKNKLVKETLVFDLTGGIKRSADPNVGALGAPNLKKSAQSDEEIPQPPEPDLQQLYEEYRLSRQRYTYYKERLIKEIEAKRGPGTAYLVFPTTAPSMPGTQLSSGPVSYQADVYTPPNVLPSAPYNTTLKAPYAPAANVTPNAPYAQQNSSNTMTSAQFLQQLQGQVGATLSGPYQAGMVSESPSHGSGPPVAPNYNGVVYSSSSTSWLK